MSATFGEDDTDGFAPTLPQELTAAYRRGKPWYGSEGEAALGRWLPWLLEGAQ